MIKLTYGNVKTDIDAWNPKRNSFTACENITSMSILLSMIASLKEGDYIIIQKKNEDNM